MIFNKKDHIIISNYTEHQDLKLQPYEVVAVLKCSC